ncbi:MAG: T9SS type A sorting domain-containing protein [Ignavibacteria bacterium]|nr:T9SS type A sorting domain-containing protein [Ignavibacteria bacterium]
MRNLLLLLTAFITLCLGEASLQSGSYTRVDFMLTLSDGIKLDCTKLIPNGTPPAGGWPVAIITHGYGLSKFIELPSAEEFANDNYYSFVYSMRGQGVSEGLSNFISTTETNDLKEVVQYIKNDANTNDNKIFIHGGSQGGIIPFMAACTGLNVKTIITDLASPTAGSNWIENGGIKMTFLWTSGYPSNIVRYNPLVSRFKPWIYANTKEKWDSLNYYLPINRDFIGEVGNCQIPVLVQNAWQDKFFNTLGMIQSAYILPYNNIKMYFGAMDGHGSDLVMAEETYKDQVILDWLDYHLHGVQNNIMNVNNKFTYAASRFPANESQWSWNRYNSPTWPPAGTENVKLYFHPSNQLQVYGYGGSQTSVNFTNDVLDPNVTMEYLVNTEFRGPLFDAKFHKEEIFFDTPALLQDAVMAGTPYAYLYYSSTANEICQYNMQIYAVRPNGNEKLVTRINWTDRDYTANQVKQKYVNGQAYSHVFRAGEKIRVKLTNLDNVPLLDFNGDTTDTFLRTNPFMLPSLKAGANKIYINNNSKSYIELPLMNFVIGIQQISAEVPQQFNLGQNYPNPFNPVTKIRFSVPNTGKNNFVKIAVYDVTGKLVTTLVDENFSAGSYEVDFNGSNYSTGVYFYRMTTNHFSEVKKMILVK